MNFQDPNPDYVEQHRDYPKWPEPVFASSVPSMRSQANPRPYSQRRHDDDDDDDSLPTSTAESLSPQPTVIPYAPTPPSLGDSASGTEIYGPDRLWGPPHPAFPRPVSYHDRPGRPGYYRWPEPVQQSPSPDHYMQRAMAAAFGPPPDSTFKDELAMAAGKVTPGMDDAPYIKYALDALTRDRDTGYSGDAPSSHTSAYLERPRFIPPQGYAPYYQPQPQFQPQFQPQPRPISAPATPQPQEQDQQRRTPPKPQTAPVPVLPRYDESPGASSCGTLGGLYHQEPSRYMPPTDANAWHNADYNDFDDVTKEKNPPPTFKPWILRPASLATLMTLCLLMTAALVFSAVYSQRQTGLTTYDSIYGGKWFLFRILPQLLASVILIYAQCVIRAVFRIYPFTCMASNAFGPRFGALFLDLTPRSFLWPQLIGSWEIKLPILVTWMANFTLPLQSSVFTVVYVDGRWRWATVQGVAWTLVALYILLTVACITLMAFWGRNRVTGLLCDPRSIANIVSLVSNSNTLTEYRDTQVMADRDELKRHLVERNIDRLGYWRKPRGPERWHGIGIARNEALPPAMIAKQLGVIKQKNSARPADKVLTLHPDGNWQQQQGPMDDEKRQGVRDEVDPDVRYHYLPWCIRTKQLLCFSITGLVLLIALLVVSFIPATRIMHGFNPKLNAQPKPGAFSAADFLYSFLPSLLGLVMFLLFQSLDQTLRILQPWAELGKKDGALADESILADYAACHPFQVTYKAYRNRHYLVATMSLLSTLFILLPVVAGGIFMALTNSANKVLMYPNIAAYAVTLALVVLYAGALASLAVASVADGFGRRYGLPHGVTCPAEVISFCAVEQTLNDRGFKNARSRAELAHKLGTNARPLWQRRWVFDTADKKGCDMRLGVREIQRYTMGPNRARRGRRSDVERGFEQRGDAEDMV